ncbi:MAG: adenosine deaminase [Actinomycetota bacterium]|nr:adenosine deaminase [Actinomycetota bacterium]
MRRCAVRDLRTLPKAHLHVHLEGAMRPETLRELATAAGVPVPTIRGFGSFSAFAEMYVAACEVLRTPADLRRLVSEVVEDAARAGAVWVEPSIYLPHHRERLGTDEAVLDIVLDAAADAATRFAIGVGLMVASDRTADPAIAVEQARLAARYAGDGVVSFGLANDEALGPPEWFAEAFLIARDAGLLSTPHAGELAGPESVAGAIDALGADRVQHGVRAVEDPDLIKRLADSPVCLDVCPTSNVLLGVVPSLGEHPLPVLLGAGIACSLNADDPLLFGPNLLEEYELVRADLGFDDATVADIARSSIEASGAPQELKATARAAIGAWMASP